MKSKKTRIMREYTEEMKQEIILADSEKLRKLAEQWDIPYDTLRKKKWQIDPYNKDRLRQERQEKAAKEQKISKDRGFSHMYWTAEEKRYLLTSRRTDEQIAQELKRTTASVRAMRFKLRNKKK